ncbi:hypothetical protein BDV95DRAFT_661088 [Massariosphaeria phaeospora]|uniref:Uncharacterized protein n=1 Tax=Massariosphaeria phaeospora TaxID=100035 RepID=A0A7C8MC38_9PLEO|nr:hypothetical protein BDV95DRAFT_661088 [Massariosphaeria phaeospora]
MLMQRDESCSQTSTRPPHQLSTINSTPAGLSLRVLSQHQRDESLTAPASGLLGAPCLAARAGAGSGRLAMARPRPCTPCRHGSLAPVPTPMSASPHPGTLGPDNKKTFAFVWSGLAPVSCHGPGEPHGHATVAYTPGWSKKTQARTASWPRISIILTPVRTMDSFTWSGRRKRQLLHCAGRRRPARHATPSRPAYRVWRRYVL